MRRLNAFVSTPLPLLILGVGGCWLWFASAATPSQVAGQTPKITAKQPAGQPVGQVEFAPLPSEKEKKIQAALDAPLKVEFVDTPVKECLEFVGEALDCATWLDVQALMEDGVATDEPINALFDKIPARTVLDLMFEPLGLTWYVDQEVLVLTSRVAAEEHLVTRCYPVGDLIGTKNADFTQIIDLIQNETEGPWRDLDGDGGTISHFDPTLTLVIRQNSKNHREILIILRSLRLIKSNYDQKP